MVPFMSVGGMVRGQGVYLGGKGVLASVCVFVGKGQLNSVCWRD